MRSRTKTSNNGVKLMRYSFRSNARSAPLLTKLDDLIDTGARSRVFNLVLSQHLGAVIDDIKSGKLKLA